MSECEEPQSKRLKTCIETDSRKEEECVNLDRTEDLNLITDRTSSFCASNDLPSTLLTHSRVIVTDEGSHRSCIEDKDETAHQNSVLNIPKVIDSNPEKINLMTERDSMVPDCLNTNQGKDTSSYGTYEKSNSSEVQMLSLSQEHSRTEDEKRDHCDSIECNENNFMKPSLQLQEMNTLSPHYPDQTIAKSQQTHIRNDLKTTSSKPVDIYDISDSDENSQPLSPLHKCKKIQNKNEIHKTEETTAKENSPDLHHGLSLRSRVVYMCSDTFVHVCDEMIRVAGRASMVHTLIQAYGLHNFMDLVSPREATQKELLQFHTADYIQFLEKISQQDDEEKYTEEAEQYGLTYDCPVHFGVYDYAVLVAGATIRAAELLVDGSCDIAMNWGGGWHHAKRDTASGFCYFNDIALGILKLREKFQRVLYVDLDLHHGDGVEDAFCTTSKVLTVSFHKYLDGFFPGTGSISDIGVSKGRHYTVNIPLLDGIKDAEFYAFFNRVMTKVREKFQPEAVVCQCGADGLAGDPMESFNLTPLGLGRCVHTLQGWKIPLLLLGGGGYNFVNTAKCWAFITSLVVGRKLPQDIPDHKYFMKYGPDYELGVSVGNRKDNNSQEYLGKVYRKVMENLNQIT